MSNWIFFAFGIGGQVAEYSFGYSGGKTVWNYWRIASFANFEK